MIQRSGGAASGAGNAGRRPQGPAPTNGSVLLVGADMRWSRVIRAVASGIGISVHTAPSGQAALGRLLGARPPHSYVLLNPARDDGLLDVILGLTSDEAGSPTSVLLLGRAPSAPSHVPVIRGPSPAFVRAALIGSGATPRFVPPIIAELQSALSGKRIDMRYQPVVRLADRQPVMLEALARLRRTGYGLVAPEHFVPQIEAAGLAADLTQRVLCRTFKDIAAAALAPFTFSIALNFPLDVLLGPDALRRLETYRAATSIAASRVIVELTESHVVADLPRLRRAVQRLRDAGYGVAIDDVSPSMPRHEALLDIPFTVMKLDKVVVTRDTVADGVDDFARRMIDRAKARGMTVIAEGVEDLSTWNRMRKAGVDLAQGFVVSRPLPVAAIPAWSRAWRARKEFG